MASEGGGGSAPPLPAVMSEPVPTSVQTIAALVGRMADLLGDNPPEVQGAALADLLATWLAGHYVIGDEVATREWRAELLELHCQMVRDLVPVNAEELGTTP